MKIEASINKALNSCLRDQLTLINQTFLHARIAKDWGLDLYNDHVYKASIRSMKFADKLIERILFLEDLPNLQELGKLMIGEDIPEMLSCDKEIYGNVRKNLVKEIGFLETKNDYVSRDELTEILESIEEEIDWIETQQWLIENSSLENYLQSQIGGKQ
tara:strand:+ start:3834 stop:4310 length:477 start_codon:yes stop_codon:yes gene_type:complete